MAIAVGINKRVSYKKETAGQWGVAAGSAGGTVLRRVTATFNLEKENYQSNEIRTDYQIQDMRHGVRSVAGSLSGELSPGTYKDFLAAAVAKDFIAPTISASAVSSTVTVTGTVYKIVRAAGDWLASGIKVGMVVRATGLTTVADNGKNLLVLAMSATELTVKPLDNSVMTAQGTATSITLTTPGKVTFAPLTGHTDDSFTVEEWYSDIAQSEVFTGNKVNTVGMSIPATGLVTCDFGFMGKDMAQTGTTAYFTAPTAQGTSGIFASVNGALVVNGAPVAVVTDVSVNINRNMQNATAVGTNSVVEMFEGRIAVDGTFSAYFENAAFRDLFANETEASLVVALTTSNAAGADFFTVALPRIKVNSNTRDDGEQGIVAQHSFTALLNSAGGTGTATEKTTIQFQDSLA
jgi:hypothetical protein